MRPLRVTAAALAIGARSAAAGGANEPIAPNELGETAAACAAAHCVATDDRPAKDSLALWLALENACFSDKQPYEPSADADAADSFAAAEAAAKAGAASVGGYASGVVGVAATTAVCVGLAVGVFVGQRSAAAAWRRAKEVR